MAAVLNTPPDGLIGERPKTARRRLTRGGRYGGPVTHSSYTTPWDATFGFCDSRLSSVVKANRFKRDSPMLGLHQPLGQSFHQTLPKEGRKIHCD